MVGTILLFEVSQRLRRISTWVYFCVFFGLAFFFVNMAGGAISGSSVDFGTGGKVLLNSPYALCNIIGYISFFGVVVTAALAGQATYQDVDSNSTAFFYTAPITKFDYLGGRFLGCLVVQALIFLSVGLGAWVGMLMPWLDRTRVGPEHAFFYLSPYFLIVWPNLLFISAIFFALAILTRKMLPVYVVSVLLLVGYLVATQLSGNFTITTGVALADPFGSNAIDRLTRYWTPFERNTRLIPLSGVILLNRVLWTAVGLLIFAFAYFRFSFAHGLPVRRSKTRQLQEGPSESTATLSLPSVQRNFTAAYSFRECLSLSRLQFKETVKNVFFAVLILAGALFAMLSAGGIFDPQATPLYPVTYRMLEFGGGGFFLFALAITTFYAGELVWRERDAGVAQIVDALPVRRWVLFSSKLIALMLVEVVLVLVILLVGVTVQASKGYYHFEFPLYFSYLFGHYLIEFWILAVLALFIHTLVNQKYAGHFVMVLYFIATIALPPMGWQHHLLLVGVIPPFVYSDMNGYGPWLEAVIWLQVYWGIAAILLAVITNLFWVRGKESDWRERMMLARERLTPLSRTALAFGLAAFVAVGAFIYYNTNVLNTYRNSYKVEDMRAQYEKNYRQYLTQQQPRVIGITTQIDLYPEQRVAQVSGTIWMENKTSAPIDRVALSLWPEDLIPIPRPHIEISKLEFRGGQTPVIEDPSLGFWLYKLPQPLAPHAKLALDFAARYPNPGFVNSQPNTDIVHNGSFTNDTYLPYIGYRPDVELTDDSVRHRHKLDNAKRAPALSDVAARQNNSQTTNADWIDFEGTVSTSLDQIAILPGYLQNEWVANGRRYFHYKMDAPILSIFSMNSARYTVLRDHWHNVNLEIYYQQGHEYNLARMMRGMKAALDYCSTNYSPFQYRQLRIIEFPRYGTFAESFPNTIPYSEAIGFITYMDPKKIDAIDMPTFVTAHETAHQWWAHQVIAANVEGMTSMDETLAQYTALMVMQHTYGPQSMKKFLRFQLDGYLRGRAQERNEERPLYRVEPLQGYIHYAKGGLVMYALQDYIGEAAVSRALANFIKAFAFKGAPYPVSTDLIGYLKAETPPDLQYLYDDMFYNITLYDNRAVSATYTKQPDGKYQVHLTVHSHKVRADGHGAEHDVPLHDYIDIGVQDAGGKFLYLQKQKIEKPDTEFTLTVDDVPALAGIDPMVKLIDRNPDDNVVAVKPAQ